MHGVGERKGKLFFLSEPLPSYHLHPHIHWSKRAKLDLISFVESTLFFLLVDSFVFTSPSFALGFVVVFAVIVFSSFLANWDHRQFL